MRGIEHVILLPLIRKQEEKPYSICKSCNNLCVFFRKMSFIARMGCGMKNPVNIEIQIDPECHDPVIVIRTDQKTQRVEDIVHAIETCTNNSYPLIVGYHDDEMELLSQRDITRVYVEARKVRICAGNEVYETNKSLSFVEQQLNPDRFIRISRFEIANLRKISSFDFSTAGTVYIRFDDGSVTWAARRYVRAIQQAISRMEAGREE